MWIAIDKESGNGSIRADLWRDVASLTACCWGELSMETLLRRASDHVVGKLQVDVAEALAPGHKLEWSLLSRVRANVLVVGDRTKVDAAIRDVEFVCRPPIHRWRCGNLPLTLLPFEAANTVVLHNVAALSIGCQQRLNDWLGADDDRTQIITTNVAPLFPLVKRRAFLEALYYRLNVVLVDVSSAQSRSNRPHRTPELSRPSPHQEANDKSADREPEIDSAIPL
jgi:hypothetical protein